jgi:hypothetical protein
MFDAAGTFTSTFLDVLSSHAFPGNVTQTFAFYNKTTIPYTPSSLSSSGGSGGGIGGGNWWSLYSPQEEFTRQGVLPYDNWYLYSDNYHTVDTYPKDFIMPSQFSMSDVGEVTSITSLHFTSYLTLHHLSLHFSLHLSLHFTSHFISLFRWLSFAPRGAFRPSLSATNATVR